MTSSEGRHYGEWALSSWYEILPGPDRLLEVSTMLSEENASLAVRNWCTKLLTPGINNEKLQSISDALISHHWHQAKRMGCIGVQFTYINGFYHRFVWRASWRIIWFMSTQMSLDMKKLKIWNFISNSGLHCFGERFGTVIPFSTGRKFVFKSESYIGYIWT